MDAIGKQLNRVDRSSMINTRKRKKKVAKMASSRVTLVMLAQKMDDNHAVNSQKMDELSRDIKEHCQKDDSRFEHIQESLDGCNEDPGLRGRLDRIEQQLKGGNIVGLQARIETVEQKLKDLPSLVHFRSQTIGIWIGATGLLTIIGGVVAALAFFGFGGSGS